MSCERRETIKVPVKNDQSPGNDDSDSKSPKRVLSDASLGGEAFQLRAIMVGNTKQREAARLVRLSLWGKADPENPLESLRELGGFSIAQSEYFYDGGDGRDEWMWNMNWRARLVRFSMPSETDATDSLRAVCSKHIDGAQCDQILRVTEKWNDLLLH